MRIFFTTPYSGKPYYQVFIDEAFKTLKKSGATVISPEDTDNYQQALRQYESRGMLPTRAHYAFIAHGIAEADIVVMEASHASLRVGHEITLALLYGKPTLVLSQKKNYADYIAHHLLTGAQYKTKRELQTAIETFLSSAKTHLSPKVANTAQQGPLLNAASDALRLTTYAAMRQHALQDDGEFGNLADLAERDPEKAYERVQRVFGNLPVAKPWSIFSSIYNEDTPDFIFTGVIKFAKDILDQHDIKNNAHIVDAFTHGGSIARHLSTVGYTNITCFSPSREMLSKTYQLCAMHPEIKIVEADQTTLQLSQPAQAIVWVDYTTNFALTETDLTQQLQNLIDNLAPNGCLIFDVRTTNGWGAYFLREKVATFATPNFQRISINLPDHDTNLITFDRFIRLKQNNGLWGDWLREQMIDRMWSLKEIQAIVKQLKHCTLEGIYDDDFLPVKSSSEPSMVYFVLKKR